MVFGSMESRFRLKGLFFTGFENLEINCWIYLIEKKIILGILAAIVSSKNIFLSLMKKYFNSS